MEKLKLTKEKLQEILKENKEPERMKYYYEVALNGEVEAYQQGGLVAFFLMLVQYYEKKLLVDISINPLDFWGLNNINEKSEYWEFYELLDRTNWEIALWVLSDEEIYESALAEFSAVHAQILFLFGSYFTCLGKCRDTLARNENDSSCNFLKASIADICHVNKTPVVYKMALANYQKMIIDKCNSAAIGIDQDIYQNVLDEINSIVGMLTDEQKEIKFTLAADNFEETKKIISEWTEEHDFYLRHNLFLNPLSNFDKYVQSSFEELEELLIEKEEKEMFDEIVNDYKMCRHITFLYCKDDNSVGKREMAMTYSYAYSIYDKIAFLLMKVYNLKIGENDTGFTKNKLFDVKVDGWNKSFGEIKNVSIWPLYIIMKNVRENFKRKNIIQTGNLEHNKLRNLIEHKSLVLVDDNKLKRNAKMLLEQTRDVILYTFMLLRSYSRERNPEEHSAISTAFLRAVEKRIQKDNQIQGESFVGR